MEEIYYVIANKFPSEYKKIVDISITDVISILGEKSNDTSLSYKFVDYMYFTIVDENKKNMDLTTPVNLFASKIEKVLSKH